MFGLSIFEKEKKYILQTYKRFPIEVGYAKGTHIFDRTGNRYLDFLAGIAVNLLGHSHPKVIEAIERQIHKYMHLSNYFYQDTQVELAELLCKLTGYDKVFFSNSGTEAIEGALKIVRRWGNLHNKPLIIAFTNGFHGRTYGSLSLMDKPHYKEMMDPFLNNILILPYNDISALQKNIDQNVAGIFIEFLQGEGGLVSATEEFASELQRLKDKFNFLIVADEIQSGIFRTGYFFAFERFNVKPDIVTLAKGIGGGLPLGAILLKSHLQNIFDVGMHGTTFGGNPVACAAGKATIEEINDNLVDKIKFVSAYLHQQLELIKNKFPRLLKEIRGFGLMKGLLLTFESSKLVEALLEEKIITNSTSKYVLRLVPPLIVTIEDIDKFINGLENVLKRF
ncbi:MAG: aspartate aminotransferase family protein [Candidatus Kapaibacteriales bacterium]